MSNKDTIQAIIEKIEREKKFIDSATRIRQATNNRDVNSRTDNEIHTSRRNIAYFEQTLRDLQRQSQPQQQHQGINSGVANLNLGPGDPGMVGIAAQTGYGHNNQQGHGGGPDYGDPGPGGYSMGGGNGLMPPRAPYAPGPPDVSTQKRPNYSKLGTAHQTVAETPANLSQT